MYPSRKWEAEEFSKIKSTAVMIPKICGGWFLNIISNLIKNLKCGPQLEDKELHDDDDDDF